MNGVPAAPDRKTRPPLTAILVAAIPLVAFAAVVASADTTTTQSADPKHQVTAPFREEHAQIHQHLAHMTEMVSALAAAPDSEQVETMRHVVRCMDEHVRKHAEWEEQSLYPVVDKYAGVGGGANTFTSTMRHEHRVVGRWIDELAAEAAKDSPDVHKFVRRADNLLGLIAAHFEEEEEVLLPVLEASMTAEQFQTEIMGKTHGPE